MAEPTGPDVRVFDLWSRFYDARLVQRLTYRPVHEAVLRALREEPCERLLDLGCGTGIFTDRLGRELALRLCVGCDYSAGMLRQAAQRRRGALLVRGDAGRLPFADEAFDVAVSTEAFHWFPDPQCALDELARVLAPGGRLLVAMVNPRLGLLSRATRLGSRLLGAPLRWPTRERLAHRVEEAGLEVEAQRTIFRLPAPLLLPCVLTAARRPA